MTLKPGGSCPTRCSSTPTNSSDLTRRTETALALGSWLVAKDWRDLFPSKRNTGSWGLLPHRVPTD